jgi:hypothetical protein
MRTSHREKSSAAKWYVGCWLSAVGCLLSPALLAEGRAADWAVTRYTEGAGTLINGTTGRIVPGAPFDISVPLPGTTRWNLIGVDTDDADTLFVLNAGNAAGYRVDWEALSTTWANLTAQRYFMHFAQGSVERSSAFSPLSFTVAPDTTLHSVDMRFTTTVINGSTPYLSFSTVTRFHGSGVPEPGSFALVLLAAAGVSCFRYHTPHPARK